MMMLYIYVSFKPFKRVIMRVKELLFFSRSVVND